MSVTIERARPSDVEEILGLVARSGLPMDGLADHLDHTIVARDNGRLVGTAALEVYRDAALLRSVAVDEGFRGRGLGQRLTQSAIELAQSLDVAALFLLTTTAERFFPKYGFDVITRDEVPPSVRASVEFTSACPASAIVMMRPVDRPSAVRRSDGSS